MTSTNAKNRGNRDGSVEPDARDKKVTMLTGHEIRLDGDLLHMLESLYREVALKRELKASFDDMMNEIVHIVEGMDEETRKAYLIESIFLNTVTYENERLGAYMKKLTGGASDDD